jgi:hypothetical protein
MDHYWVHTSKDAKGHHEVHKDTCHKLPNPNNRADLGYQSNCLNAVIGARGLGYVPANGCRICSVECHTG